MRTAFIQPRCSLFQPLCPLYLICASLCRCCVLCVVVSACCVCVAYRTEPCLGYALVPMVASDLAHFDVMSYSLSTEEKEQEQDIDSVKGTTQQNKQSDTPHTTHTHTHTHTHPHTHTHTPTPTHTHTPPLLIPSAPSSSSSSCVLFPSAGRARAWSDRHMLLEYGDPPKSTPIPSEWTMERALWRKKHGCHCPCTCTCTCTWTSAQADETQQQLQSGAVPVTATAVAPSPSPCTFEWPSAAAAPLMRADAVAPDWIMPISMRHGETFMEALQRDEEEAKQQNRKTHTQIAVEAMQQQQLQSETTATATSTSAATATATSFHPHVPAVPLQPPDVCSAAPTPAPSFLWPAAAYAPFLRADALGDGWTPPFTWNAGETLMQALQRHSEQPDPFVSTLLQMHREEQQQHAQTRSQTGGEATQQYSNTVPSTSATTATSTSTSTSHPAPSFVWPPFSSVGLMHADAMRQHGTPTATWSAREDPFSAQVQAIQRASQQAQHSGTSHTQTHKQQQLRALQHLLQQLEAPPTHPHPPQ